MSDLEISVNGDERVRAAAERYRSGKVSIDQAARIAGLSVAEWLATARDRDLTTQLRPEDLRRDVAAAGRL
jgi:predicted HTH domain antitoxin